MNWEIKKEMKKHGVESEFELKEFDKWANDATRKDINNLLKKESIFGLKLWEFIYLEGDMLYNVPDFGVTFIFRKKDKAKVIKEVEKFQNFLKKYGGDFKKIKKASDRLIDRLSNLAIYIPAWV
jgi:hypothetical protein